MKMDNRESPIKEEYEARKMVKIFLGESYQVAIDAIARHIKNSCDEIVFDPMVAARVLFLRATKDGLSFIATRSFLAAGVELYESGWTWHS